MERPYALDDTKQLRWTATPSEEQLFGTPRLAASPPTASFEPTTAPVWSASESEHPDPSPAAAPPSRWRPQGRDLIALGAVAVAVCFAVRGADQLPFRWAGKEPPATASAIGSTNVLADRQELATLPRESRLTQAAAGAAGDHQDGKDGLGSSRDGDGRDQPPSTGEDPQKPLLQANVPGVGSVTVEQPDLPGISGLGLPDLPETEVAVPGTASVSLP